MNIPYASLFVAAGAKYHVDPALLAAVAKQESGFNPNAVSPAGALGLMQIMPDVAASLGVNAYDPAQAVNAAAYLLAKNLQQFGSDTLAVAAYNAGPGAVAQYGGVPPYAETQDYVRKVLGYRDQFEGTIGSGTSWKTAAVVGAAIALAGGAVWWAKKRFLR
jgi:soluble lytic murein transglycosylase-like protein